MSNAAARNAAAPRWYSITVSRAGLCLLALLVLAAPQAQAIDDLAPLPNAELQARYDRLTDELRCVKCQNQNIADSNAGIARDLRLKVREMLIEGRSDGEILDYMVARYGDFVLYRPPFKPSTAILWLAPFLLLLLAGLVVANTVRNRTRLYDPTVDVDDEIPAEDEDGEAPPKRARRPLPSATEGAGGAGPGTPTEGDGARPASTARRPRQDDGSLPA